MLSGRLPTGTVEDRSGDVRRGEERARTGRTERRGDRERAETPRERERPTFDGPVVDASTADLATENRRLKRRLASERAERQAVIDRYERLLAERRETDEKTCGGDDGARERTTARVRRALSRLRRWCGRFRSRRG
ncbi:MAG: hypothetical protein ABEH47_07820 [Haloferacaceae archaeon]